MAAPELGGEKLVQLRIWNQYGSANPLIPRMPSPGSDPGMVSLRQTSKLLHGNSYQEVENLKNSPLSHLIICFKTHARWLRRQALDTAKIGKSRQ